MPNIFVAIMFAIFSAHKNPRDLNHANIFRSTVFSKITMNSISLMDYEPRYTM